MRHRHLSVPIHILRHEDLRRNIETQQLRVHSIQQAGNEGRDERLRTAQDGGISTRDGEEGTEVRDAGREIVERLCRYVLHDLKERAEKEVKGKSNSLELGRINGGGDL